MNDFQGSFRQSMAWLHTWAGLVFTLLLYFVFLTGTVGYFYLEIDQWMQPERPTFTTTFTDAELVDVGHQYLLREAPDSNNYFVDLPTERDGGAVRVYASLNAPGPDGETYISTYLDPTTGQELVTRDTGGGEMLYEMHYALHYIPYEVAIYIVGVGTLFMFLAIVTGIVTHKKIFVDFFTLRLGKGQRSWLDGHNVSSVLALPFMLMITYSGLVFYTFEYSPGVMFLNMGLSEQAQEEMYEHLYAGYTEPTPIGESAELIDLAVPIADAQRRWSDAALRYVEVLNPGDASATIWIGREPTGLQRGGDALNYSGVTGELLGQSEPMASDSLFSSVILALHEGHFANYFLRWLYFISGLLGAAMVATGTLLWAKKRRSQLKTDVIPASLNFIERTNLGIIVGLPLGILAYFYANRLLPLAMENRAEWEMHGLFVIWGLSFVHAAVRPIRQGWREQVGALAALCLCLPLINAITTDVHLVATIAANDWVRAGFDITLLCFAFALWWVHGRLSKPALNPGVSLQTGPAPISGKAGA